MVLFVTLIFRLLTHWLPGLFAKKAFFGHLALSNSESPPFTRPLIDLRLRMLSPIRHSAHDPSQISLAESIMKRILCACSENRVRPEVAASGDENALRFMTFLLGHAQKSKFWEFGPISFPEFCIFQARLVTDLGIIGELFLKQKAGHGWLGLGSQYVKPWIILSET